ncbi:hypothetical protein PINS_up018739 [Pythium insidiosum]|nr:hypothetical protein PINS_up018739 [Pythium insidiosum]
MGVNELGHSGSKAPRLHAVRSAPSVSTVELPSSGEHPGETSPPVLDRSRSDPSQVHEKSTLPPGERTHPSCDRQPSTTDLGGYDDHEAAVSAIDSEQDRCPTQRTSGGRCVEPTESSPSAHLDTEISLDSGRDYGSFDHDTRQSAGEDNIPCAAAPRMALPPLKGARVRAHSSYVSQDSTIYISEDVPEFETPTGIPGEPGHVHRQTACQSAEKSIKPLSSASSRPEDDIDRGIRSRFVRPFISRRSSAPSGMLVDQRQHPHPTDSSSQPRPAGGIIAALTASNPFMSRQPRGRQSPLQLLADQLWSRNESNDDGEKPPRRKTSHPTLALGH